MWYGHSVMKISFKRPSLRPEIKQTCLMFDTIELVNMLTIHTGNMKKPAFIRSPVEASKVEEKV